MCDTYICLGNSTKDGSVIFGKNSDRLSNEAQLITYSPQKQYSEGEELECTHISIPQVKETAAVLLSQPWWMWGAEIGVNEYDVVIGNEAVATKEPLNETGLLGMDLLRLGLERGKTAKDALNTITELLEKHGQGGAHNLKGLNYHNSMIIADPKEAYVLETAGEWWIVEVVKDFRSISNNISIRGKGDIRRKGIIQHAIEKEYCKDDNDFDFKMIFSAHPLPDKFPVDSRDGCSMNQLANHKGKIAPSLMMSFLREHDVGICMHGRSDRSVGSLVSHIREGKKAIHWFTGSTIPCLSIYKPYTFPIEDQRIIESKPYDETNPEWYWVKHDIFMKNFAKKPKKENPDRELIYDSIKTTQRKLIKLVEDNFQNAYDLAWKESEELIQ